MFYFSFVLLSIFAIKQAIVIKIHSHEGLRMGKQMLRWLKVSACLYGILITLTFGGVLLSLFTHGDLMLIQAPLRLDWIVGDIVLLLTIFWGILFALANLAESNALSLLSLVFALIAGAIVGWIN